MSEIQLTDNNFEEEVLKSEGLTLVDFWAPWCGPCRMLGPIIEEIANENSDIKVGKLNVDEERVVAAKYGIMSIPTVMLFKNGQLAETMLGLQPKESFIEVIEKNK